MTNPKIRIVFWTEGGQGIGIGHVSRSLVIAGEFRRLGYPVSFIVNDDNAVRDRLKDRGVLFETGELKIGTLSEVRTKAPGTLFVFDTKKDVASLMRATREAGSKVVLLDNTTPARLDANVVIYPSALFEDNLDWPGFAGRYYGGPQYVPVDGKFVVAREKCRRLKLEPPYNILVTMGGSDPRQLTSYVLNALLPLSLPAKVTVVIGPAFYSDPELTRLEKENRPGLSFIRNLGDLSSIMADSHVAVTALGLTIFELAVVGVPGVIVANYVEDQRDLEGLRKLGMHLPLGYHRDVTLDQIKETVARLVETAPAWRDAREKGWNLIDGCGAERIVECIVGDMGI